VDAVTQFEQQCIAFPPDPSESLLTEWIKSDFNPVYSAQFARDPTTAWNNGTHWQLAIGQNGHASLLTSSDFLLWQNTGILYENANFSSIFWECPDLYIIPGSSPPVYVFKASANFQPFHGQDVWSVGHFDPSNRVAFAPLSQSAPFGSRLYDYGGLFYASKSFHDSSVNRQVLFGWINEADAESEHIARGWAGMQSVPREIHLRSDGFNIRTPVIPALEQLRGAMESLNMTISQPRYLFHLRC
jgi:beta-fructofuranosidase